MATRNKSQEMAESIIDALKQGTAPWIKPWKPEQSASPHNPVTGTRYKGANSLYLSIQGKNDPRWVTFKQAHKMGWQVKKGSKGTIVQYWQFNKEKTEIDEKGEEIKKTVQLERPILRHYYVFNGSDIEGIPELQKPESDKSFKRHERGENILQRSGAEIEHRAGDKAAYYPMSDKIIMPKRRQFDTPDGYYVTALHELSHWTGHKDRLDRNVVNVFGSQEYAREELRAEIASYMIGMQLEIGHDPGQHLAYVDSWIKDLENHPNEIFKASADAEKILTYILEFELEKSQEQEVNMKDSENTPGKTKNEAPMSMPGMPESQVNEITGKRYISFYSNKEIDSAGNINLELQQSLQRGTTIGVLRYEKALEKDIAEEPGLNISKLKEAGIDGVVLTDKGKPIKAICTEENTLYRNMFQAVQGLEKKYIKVPYKDKDEVQAKGAVWDQEAKSWFIVDGLDSNFFTPWTKMVTADNPQQLFAEFIREKGGNLQGEMPVMDGKFHRIPDLDGKPGNKDVSYVGYMDGIPAGYVKNFRGQEARWKMSGVSMTNEDKEKLFKEAQEKKIQREKEITELYEKKAVESQSFTNGLNSATGKEEYFTKKGINIKDPNVKIDSKGNIIIPLVDLDGKQWSHQILQINGFKQIFKDSRLKGNFALIGAQSIQDLKGDIFMTEGYSTGATINEITGNPVFVSFTSHNLKNVASSLRDRFPDKEIYIMADDDKHLVEHGKTNAGQVYAKEAAKSVNGHVINPYFVGRPDKTKTDFNDMARIEGKEKVRRHINAKMELAHSGKKIEKEKNKIQERKQNKAIER